MTEKKTAFLGTPGFVPAPERFSNSDLLKAVGANSGNLLFQYAATRLIGGKREHIGFSGKSYGDVSVFRGLDYFVFPAANHLRSDGDWKLLTGFLKLIKAPLVVLGLGAQAEQGADPRKTADALRQNQSVVDLVELFAERAQLITVRGKFSEAVCHELGLTKVMRLGCQSQLINPDPSLGANVARQLAELKEGDGSARIGLTASAPNELHGWRRNLEEKLFEWIKRSGGLYVQQSCEDWFFNGAQGHLAELDEGHLAYAHAHIAPAMESDEFLAALRAAFRLYFDAGRWIDEIGETDITIGTRIHGNMAALAASRPGILVVHDARVTELATEMHIPQVEGDAVIGAKDYIEVLRQVEFDDVAFDSARLEKAARLAKEFERLGIPPSDHLASLAQRSETGPDAARDATMAAGVGQG
jgi:hypothetical protein